MTDLQRIKILLKTLQSLGLASSQNEIGKKLGYSSASAFSQVVNGSVAIPKNFADRVVKAFPVVNIEWLTTGTGEMLHNQDVAVTASSVDVLMLPVINLDTRAGLGSYNEVVDTPLYIAEQMPFSRSIARDGDFVMPVVGESMTPRYPNGTYVLVRPLPTWREYLELGATYVLELIDGRRLIKEIRAGSDTEHFTLQSVNPAFDPSEIAKNFIAHIFAVIVSVRRDYNW